MELFNAASLPCRDAFDDAEIFAPLGTEALYPFATGGGTRLGRKLLPLATRLRFLKRESSCWHLERLKWK